MSSNPFDSFDAPAANPFDIFDEETPKDKTPRWEGTGVPLIDTAIDVPMGIGEFLTTSAAQAIGSVGAKAAGGLVGMATPGTTAQEKAAEYQDRFGRFTAPLESETGTGQRLNEWVGKGIEHFQHYAQDPEKIKNFLSLIPFAGDTISNDVRAQAATSALATAIPDIAMVAGAHGVLKGGVDLGKGVDKSIRKPTTVPPKGQDLGSLATKLSEPEVPKAPVQEAPLVDPRTGQQLSHEAYTQALRERELQQQSAFNRPEQLGNMELDGPMERMARDLGAEPGKLEQPLSRMAEDLTNPPRNVVEGATAETAARQAEALSLDKQREAQVTLDNRKAAMEQEVAQRTTLEQQAAERSRQDNAPVYSPEHMAEVERVQRMSDVAFDKYVKEIADAKKAADGLAERAKNDAARERAAKAQEDVSLRQKAVEVEVARRTSLDFNAAERARRESGTIPVDQEKHPFVKAAEDKVDKAERLLLKMTSAAEEGHPPTATQLVRAKRDLADLQARADKVRANVSKERQNPYGNDVVNMNSGIPIPWDTLKALVKSGALKRLGTSLKGMKVYRAVGAGESLSGPRNAGVWVTPDRDLAVNVYAKGDASRVVEDYMPERDLYEAHPGGWVYAPEGTDIANVKRTATQTFGEMGKTGPARRQGGGVRLDWSKKNETKVLKGIKELKGMIGDVMPDHRTEEQFISDEKNTPDISQNMAQRAMNSLTKGSQFLSMRTGSPLLQRVGTAMRGANNRAKAAIAEHVHGMLAPAAQKLTTPDRTAIVSAMQLAEKNGKALTEDLLVSHGFNEKQINWWKAHTEAMGIALGKMNEAMKATGHEPVSPRVAYLASKGTGDFRRLIYKTVDGEKQLVSMLGDSTRTGLDDLVGKLRKAHPEYTVGEEKFFGGGAGKGKSSGDMKAVLELLGKNDDNVKLLADHVNDILTNNAHDYMNAKSHTMQKKGILGMEGRKEFATADQNAKDAVQAQIDYVEKILKWAELTKAVEEIKPILHPDNGLNMPKAKALAEEYTQRALGNNPSKVGQSIDNAFAELGNSVGIGPSVGRSVLGGAKGLANGLLIGFAKPGFLLANIIQPGKAMPEMAAFLKGRGLDKSFDAGTGATYLAKGIATAAKDAMGKPIASYMKDALSYAKENHVYSSDLFDSSNKSVKDFGHYWNKMSQFGTGAVEMRTRQSMFLGLTEMLHENGLTKADGLYETAQNLTDMAMNNYDKAEAPSMYHSMGSVGKTASNLLSYKHNEYSRLSMFANEISKHKELRPLAVALASSIAFAGIMGTVGYTEADWLIKKLSSALGKPTSLTKMLLDNPDIGAGFTHGMGATAGVDMSGQLGAGAVLPGSALDAVMPGASKLVKLGEAGYTAATNPNEFNLKNFAREAAPGIVTGAMDRRWFSKDDAQGNEMAISRSTGKPTVTRNDVDKLWKSLGMTGINESRQRAINWENDSITKIYHDKQTALVDNATKTMMMTGKIPQDFPTKFINAQGDPNSLNGIVNKMALEGSIDHRTAQLLYASVANLPNAHKLMRLTGQE